MTIDGNAGSLTENLIALIEAAGGSRPESKGLQELYQSLAVALSAFSPGGGIQTIVAGTNITVDDTDPENPIVSSTGGGGGGGGGGIGSLEDIVFSDNQVTFVSNGTSQACDVIVASPPSWLDTSGTIIEPGLYLMGVAFTPIFGGAMTTADQYGNFANNFFNQNVPLNPIKFVGGSDLPGNTVVMFILAIGEGDLPWVPGQVLDMPTDATGTFSGTSFAWQLATGSGGSPAIMQDGFYLSDAETTQAADGSFLNVACITASPPAWLDGSGNITEEGQYIIALFVTADVNFTTPGLNLLFFGATRSETISCDGVDFAGSGSTLVYPQTLSLPTADAPASGSIGVQMPTDASGVVRFQVGIQRILG